METTGDATAAATIDHETTHLAAMGSTTEGVSYFFAFSNELNLQSSDGAVVPVPHIEWDGGKFCKATLPPLPTLEVVMTPLISYHVMFKKRKIDATASNLKWIS